MSPGHFRSAVITRWECEDCGDGQQQSEQNDVYGCHRCGGRRVLTGNDSRENWRTFMSSSQITTDGGTPRPRMSPESFRTKVKSELRQSVWEASQIMSAEDIEGFVCGVLEEIEADA